MTDRTDDTAPRTTTLRTESLVSIQMRTAEGTHILTDITATCLTEISIGIQLRTAVRTGHLTDLTTAGSTEHGFRVIDCTTMGADDT